MEKFASLRFSDRYDVESFSSVNFRVVLRVDLGMIEVRAVNSEGDLRWFISKTTRSKHVLRRSFNQYLHTSVDVHYPIQ